MSKILFPAFAAVLMTSAASAEPLKVVASFSILGDMAGVVGGDRVEVVTLVGPDGDAHVYQPTPRDARTVADADLVVVNGLKFEGFIERVVAAAEYKGPVVVAASAVKPIEADDEHEAEGSASEHAKDDHDHDHAAEEHAAAEHDHAEDEHAAADHHGHDHGGLDPHAWQSLANGALYVTAIAEGLCKADPEGCPTFTANANAYRAEILDLDASIRSRIAAVPEEGRVVITSHDAFGYFGREYGVRFVAPQGVSTESEASAAGVADIIRQIRETGVRAVFLENMVDPRLAEQIARESGATMGGVLYADALSAPGTAGESYLKMMRANADALIAAMAPRS